MVRYNPIWQRLAFIGPLGAGEFDDPRREELQTSHLITVFRNLRRNSLLPCRGEKRSRAIERKNGQGALDLGPSASANHLLSIVKKAAAVSCCQMRMACNLGGLFR